MSRRLILACAVLAACAGARAADDEEALRLADQTDVAQEHASPWRTFGEGALRASRMRNGAVVHGARLSLDTRYEDRLAPGWRASFADRLDLTDSDDASRGDQVNTLKEAFVSWQMQGDRNAERNADFGRINARQGVAMGYNPTDMFKQNALRSIVSVDPASLRENRMGTVMARGQVLWDKGALTAIFAPRLAAKPSSSAFSPDLGATNASKRWMLAASREILGTRPQWLISGEPGVPVRIGANATALLGDATVAYLEWSVARENSLRARALGLPEERVFRHKAAAGLTYTTPFKLSLTAEVHYNGAGLDRAGWGDLARAPADAYARYRALAAALQEPPTRDAAFFYASWQDALLVHLDVTAMQRRDRVDQSRLSWLEFRYRHPRADVALQWQRAQGGASSNFGALPEARAVQALLRLYF